MASKGLLLYKSAGEMYAEEQEQEQAAADAETKRRREFESSLAGHIRSCWSEAKMAKREVEERMLDCLRRRKGEYPADKLEAMQAAGSSMIFMMLTATKCRAAASWIRDILMPANERPWGLDPTPVSEIPPEYVAPAFQQFMQNAALKAQQTGEQLDPQEVMKAAEDHIRHLVQERAEDAAKLHEDVIADQLAEGQWDSALEAFIDDFVTFPAAIIRGHNLRRVSALAWKEGWEAIKVQELRPEWYRVSPFDLYPSADATDIDDGAFIIERARFTRAQLTQCLGVPSYSDDAIRMVLEEHGQTGLRDWLWTDSERADLEGRSNEMLTKGQTIDGLIYCGGAQGTTLLQWGVNPDEIEDPLGEYEVEAILIGQHVIRVKFNRDPLERRPYHKASFQQVPGSFWGQGIPELMADIQDVCNATARSLMNNLAISSGPQVDVDVSRLSPDESPDDIYPWKIWKTKGSAAASGANPAIRFYQPTSNAAELLAVYEKFEIRADDATNIPRYSYGNERVGGAGQTASGLSMLMESANKGIKDAIRHIDRGVIRRVIEGLWLHNMQYSDNDAIKGDASVVPRGSSAMLIREQTHNMRAQFLAQTANPIDMGIIGNEGRRKLLDAIAEKLDLPGVIPSEDKMLENMSSQSQAAQEQAQIETMAKQAEAQEKMARADKAIAETEETRAMTPLEVKKLMIEILTAMQGGAIDGREIVEGTGQTIQHGRGPAATGNPAPAPGGSPGLAGGHGGAPGGLQGPGGMPGAL